jgi:hypothetical protein
MKFCLLAAVTDCTHMRLGLLGSFAIRSHNTAQLTEEGKAALGRPCRSSCWLPAAVCRCRLQCAAGDHLGNTTGGKGPAGAIERRHRMLPPRRQRMSPWMQSRIQCLIEAMPSSRPRCE